MRAVRGADSGARTIISSRSPQERRRATQSPETRQDLAKATRFEGDGCESLEGGAEAGEGDVMLQGRSGQKKAAQQHCRKSTLERCPSRRLCPARSRGIQRLNHKDTARQSVAIAALTQDTQAVRFHCQCEFRAVSLTGARLGITSGMLGSAPRKTNGSASRPTSSYSI